MKNYTEYFKTKKALFKRANAILKKNGLYDVSQRQGLYFIDYIFSENSRSAYRVLKGRNDEAFNITIGGKGMPRHTMELVKGDILYFCYQKTNKTFFYCPKALIGKREFKMEACMGFTNYSKKTAMLDDGLIESCLTCDLSTYLYQITQPNYGSDYPPY